MTSPQPKRHDAAYARGDDLKAYLGDNLAILPQLGSGRFRLIYIDPPFNTGRARSHRAVRSVRAPAAAAGQAGFAGRRYVHEERSHHRYADSFADYGAFLRPRLEEAHRLLSADGSLLFHIDWREAARCRLLLEEVFGGPEHVINEIIWAYDYGGRSKSRWPAKHDNIYWLAKDPASYVYDAERSDRIPYLAPGLQRPERARRGKTPTDTWWLTIVPTSGRERTGYPTQKPLSLLERIVKVHSEPGDWVLDFFAGSGTTGAAALRQGRRCVLIDSNPAALAIISERLEKVAAKP